VYERIGLVTPRMADLIPRETLIKHHIFNLELMEKENHRIAKEIGFAPGTILVEDLGELTMAHLYVKIKQLILDIAASDEQRYPESIRKVYIVNPPTIFNLAWGLVRPLMDENTATKFAMGVPKDFIKEWDAIIGKESLPKSLGGTLEWDPPKGGIVDKYVPKNLEKKTIGTGKEHGNLFIEQAMKKGHTFHWQIMCDKDLKFALYVKTGSSNDERKVVEGWALKEYHEDFSPWHGWHTVPEDQTLLLHIDNTGNWTARKIKYFTYIQDPNGKREKKKEEEKKEEVVKKVVETKDPKKDEPAKNEPAKKVVTPKKEASKSTRT
jgi:molybdopterin converting factor small subunit